MKVIFLPDYSDSNPYQEELAEALTKYNINVILSKRFSFLPLVRSVCFYGKPDVLHLHWTESYVSSKNRAISYLKGFRFIIDLIIIKLLRIKIVWTVHNLLEHDKRNPHIELFFNRIIIRFYNKVIVHCFYAKDVLIETYNLPELVKKKINVIPHGNYIRCYENKISKTNARYRLGVDNRSLVFLYFGSIRPYKGVVELIKVFYTIQNPIAHLLIVGNPLNDEIRSDIMKLCKKDNRINTHLKFIPDEDIQIYMNAADVVVLPFKEILTSGSALLAMSFGTAVIAPRMGCVSETLEEDGCIFYDSTDEFGLLKALNIAQDVNLSSMGEKNYSKVKQFDWDRIAEQTANVYLK